MAIEIKSLCYEEEGFVLFDKATLNDEKILIITEKNPNGGINSKNIEEIVKKYILEI